MGVVSYHFSGRTFCSYNYTAINTGKAMTEDDFEELTFDGASDEAMLLLSLIHI